MSYESNVPINDTNVAIKDSQETSKENLPSKVAVPTFWERWKRDFLYLIPFVVVPLLLVRGDLGTIYVLAYVIAVSLLFAFVSHIVRKIIFPYVDLASLVKKSYETSLGAAIVFASILSFLMVIYYSTVSLMR